MTPATVVRLNIQIIISPKYVKRNYPLYYVLLHIYILNNIIILHLNQFAFIKNTPIIITTILRPFNRDSEY